MRVTSAPTPHGPRPGARRLLAGAGYLLVIPLLAARPGMVTISAGVPPVGEAAVVVAGSATGSPAPSRQVIPTTFLLAVTETTWSEWREVRGWALRNGYADLAGVGAGNQDDHPVHSVSWWDAILWLNAKSEKEGLVPVYHSDDRQKVVCRSVRRDLTSASVKWAADGYRLPTESEWERAARGGEQDIIFPWGNTIGVGNASFRGTIYTGRGLESMVPDSDYQIGTRPHTVRVASFNPNRFGLYDVAGNVAEWCWDRFKPPGEGGGGSARDADSGGLRMTRGGSWNSPAEGIRIADRGGARDPFGRSVEVGFRYARSLAPPVVRKGPVPSTVFFGQSAVFAVSVAEAPGVRLQWMKDGVPIPGATLSLLVIPAAKATDAGCYSIEATNEGGTTVSSSARLEINTPSRLQE